MDIPTPVYFGVFLICWWIFCGWLAWKHDKQLEKEKRE